MKPCDLVNSLKECIAVRRTGPPARCMNCKPGRANEEKSQGMDKFPPTPRPQGRVVWERFGEMEKLQKKEMMYLRNIKREPAEATNGKPRRFSSFQGFPAFKGFSCQF